MKRAVRLAILAAAPLLTAALWMDRQPSYKPYEAPVIAPPADSVPVSGREDVSRQAEQPNPVPATPESVARGKELFEINCALCHGSTSAQPGPVGRKLVPPAPGLDPVTVSRRSDAHIFKAIALGFGRMPPFKEKIPPRQRWDLINFLRTRT